MEEKDLGFIRKVREASPLDISSTVVDESICSHLVFFYNAHGRTAVYERMIRRGVEAEAIVLNLHGGGFVKGLTTRDRVYAAALCMGADIEVWNADYSLVPEFVKISSVVFAVDAFPPSCIIPFCSIDKPPNVRVYLPDSDGESLSILSSPFEFLTVKTPPTEKVRVETYKDAESRLCAEGLGICESIVKSPPIFTSPLSRNATRVMYQSAELRASEKRKSPRVSKTAPALI